MRLLRMRMSHRSGWTVAAALLIGTSMSAVAISATASAVGTSAVAAAPAAVATPSAAAPSAAPAPSAASPSARPAKATPVSATYTNPVTDGATETFPDPTVIRGKDGWWYAYASRAQILANTGDKTNHRMGILRSRDQVKWSYVGDVFPNDERPSWQRPGSDSWAPDIRYLDGRYVLYYSVANPPPGQNDSFTIAVATAPTPRGPWKDSGGPVIPPKGACDTFTDIDPAQITAANGDPWLVWGSFRNLCTAKLTADGLRTTGPVTQIWKGAVEGGYVVRHGDWYYLFGSQNNCCIGETSSYQVRVGRSRAVDGPYVDQDGVPLTKPVSKGTFAIANNGNRFVGPGHMAVSTDRSGQDWMVYHAVPRDHAHGAAGGPDLIRPMMIDRLDWIDGWPTVRAGAWASDTPQTAPMETRLVGSGFDDGQPLTQEWAASGSTPEGWTLDTDPDSGRFATHPADQGSAYLFTKDTAVGDLRVEGNLRQPTDSTGAAGLVVRGHDNGDSVVSWLDAGRHMLVTEVRGAGRTTSEETALPSGFRYDTWHTVTADLRGTSLHVEVTDAGQHDPVAEQDLTVPVSATRRGQVGVAGRGTTVDADEVGASRLFEPVTQAVPDPSLGELDPAYSDEFNGDMTPGTTPNSGWRWVRKPVGSEGGGSFAFPTTGELYGGDNSASVLTRPAPDGDYTVETKFDFDGSTQAQQAGLVAYAGDDQYLKLTSLILNDGGATDGKTAVTSFAKDVVGSPYGEAYVGPPAGTLWLRLTHHVDPGNGENEYRAATSQDGKTWVFGATWTLPSGTSPKIALAAMNAPGATAKFDYLRVYRPAAEIGGLQHTRPRR